MKTLFTPAWIVLLLSGTISFSAEADEVPKTLVAFSGDVLAKIGEDPTIVAAVRAQNNSGLTLDRIKEIDKVWMGTKGVSRLMLNYMSNETALALYNYQYKYKFIAEAFVTDNKGANVGQTNRTSDYWQGDEAKFTKSFAGGEGAIFFGNVEYDDSIDEIVVQVSVPVREGGRAIGTITFGISLDRWERR